MMYFILTAINIIILLSWIAVIRYLRVPWRSILAMLPTPMLGFASSYGVYAFNTRLTPEWVAMVMAAAFEMTYIGIAAYVNLSRSQVDKGRAIARDAAIISFCQNAIAGLFYVQPSLLSYQASRWALAVNLPLALLHAAQVWIAYRAANFTLHGSSSDVNQTVNVDTFEAPTNQVDGHRQLPEPVLLDAAGDRLDRQPKRQPSAAVDGRVDDWLAQVDDGMSYGEISRQLGGQPSRQYIASQVANRKRQLEGSVNR